MTASASTHFVDGAGVPSDPMPCAGPVDTYPQGGPMAHDTNQDTGDVCDVSLSTIDALGVGQTLRSLARDRRTPHGQREILSRVGSQMVSAATAKLATSGKAGRR